MDEWGLPGLQARFEFVPAGETVELRLDLRFDPAKAELTQTSRNAWLKLRDRLSGAGGDNARFAAVNLVTSLAPAPLTVTADGAGLREQFVDFVSSFADLPAQADAPAAAALTFSLPKAGVATLPGDIFELDVRLEIGPVPIAIASPRRGEEIDVVDFAAAFEETWQGYDGADGRIALAVEDRPEGAAFWCVRAGAKSGLALAAPKQAEAVHYAVPPLSTSLLSGTIEHDSGTGRFTAVDLDSWWDSFAAGFERMELAAGSGEIAGRFKRVRAALAAGLASRLLPLAKAELGDGLAEVRSVYEAAAEADLRSRPVVASALVEVGRGTGPSNDPETVLLGIARTPAGTASAVTASPAAVRLARGPQRLAYTVAPLAEDGVRGPSPIRFEADRIERQDALPLRLLPRAPGETDLLGLDFERSYPPMPRIEAPDLPGLSVAAKVCGEPATLSDALTWSVEVEARTDFSELDRLELALGFDGEAAAGPQESPAFYGTLFEALGRAVLAARAMPDVPDAASVERFAVLAESVAKVLAGWPPPVADVRPLPGKWRYVLDFRGLPALIVSREAQGSGQLPPWPAISGFVTPASGEGQARFEPEAGAETKPGLRLSFTGLRLLADRAVRVHGRTSRNANLVDSVGPAFVYPGTIESSTNLKPRLDWQAPQPEPRAARLEAALAALLHAIDEPSGAPYILSLEGALLRRLETAAGSPFESRIPLLRVPNMEVGGAVAVADLARRVAAALSAARAGIEPDLRDEEVALTIGLSDCDPARSPLARLEFRIPVAGDETWWGPPT
ncbi:MAG TPA: hypothetical protein VE891_10685 [Allosphingosinicella sp.]|nr:hypothetical protein [Allosphingosinicella sp.]